MSTKNDSYTSTGLDRMLDQFDGSLNLRSLVSVYLDQVQALEDAIHPLLAERDLDQATGDRLDGIGAIVNINRSGRSDADYRLRLKAELLILGSGGTAEDLLTVAQALIQMTTADYELVELAPKTVYIRPVDHVLTQAPASIGSALRRTVSAATQLLFVYSLLPDANTFQFSTTTSSESDTDTGYGEVYTPMGTWLYDSASTSLSGLTSGTYRFNDTDITNATQMYVHDEDASTADKSVFLASLDVASGASLVLNTVGQAAHIYISDTTDNTGTFTFDIAVAQEIGTIPYAEVTVLSASNTGGYMAGNA